MPSHRYRFYMFVYTWTLEGLRRATKNEFYLSPSTKTCVTHHARIRYLQRVMNIDLDDLNRKIAPPEVKRRIKELGGNGRFQHNGLMYVVMDAKIVTVYPPTGTNKNIVEETKNGRVWVF